MKESFHRWTLWNHLSQNFMHDKALGKVLFTTINYYYYYYYYYG